jgi:hypothetical protein
MRENCFASTDEIILVKRRLEMIEAATITRAIELIRTSGALRRNFMGDSLVDG